MEKLDEKTKEELILIFLKKFYFTKPVGMGKEKINKKISKYWNDNDFWRICTNNFTLLKDKDFDFIVRCQVSILFWQMLNSSSKAKFKEVVNSSNETLKKLL